MNLRKLDLNLLTVFDAIVMEGSLTRAAEGIGMSQPAMSNALSRLRHALGDDLFVRDGRTIQPTPRALELAPQVREALELLSNALDTPPRFDPGKKQEFTIGCFDYFEAVVLPDLQQRVLQRSPESQLVSRTGVASTFLKPLRYGGIDLVIDYVPLAQPDVIVEALFDEELILLACENNPIVNQKMDIRLFSQQRFALREDRPDEPTPEVDLILGANGLKRDIAMSVTNWLALPFLVSQSALVATAPRYLVTRFAKHLPLRVMPLPFKIKPIPIYMMWHATKNRQPENRWLRAQIKRSCREMIQGRPAL